jgi:hypothetical protein
MIARIYITYCSWQKDDQLKGTGVCVTPDKLYLSKRIQSFITRCRDKNVKWAIYSDYCGVWFPEDLHAWYDLHPNNVPEESIFSLSQDFNRSLSKYDEIYYFYDKRTLHPLYERIVNESGISSRVYWFEDINIIA